MYDKKSNVVQVKVLKLALDYRLILGKVHKVINFNQEVWLKPYIDINTELRRKAKNDFVKNYLNLMNNSVFKKTMENVRNDRDIKIATVNKRRNKLKLELN